MKEILIEIGNGMFVRVYDAKVRHDKNGSKYPENALANIYFYHRTVVKVITISIDKYHKAEVEL